MPTNRWRKKPVVIEATQWFHVGDHDAVREYRPMQSHQRCKQCGHVMHEHGSVDTLEGQHIVCPGDWIITGIKGETYPCKPDIFAATYDPE